MGNHNLNRVASDPRRGFVFAMLAGGILSTAIRGAVALYSLGTNLLGSPFENWQQVARVGASAFVVGVIILAIYLWTARREHLFSGLTKRLPTEEASSSMEPAPELIVKAEIPPDEILPNIDVVLDELLAGKITRDEAAKRIQRMMNKEVTPK